MVSEGRAYAGVSAVLAAVLSGIVLRDVYVDWQLEGKPLWSTVVENALPLVLGVAIFAGGQWAYRNRSRFYVENVAKWQVFGAVGTAVIVGWVIGLQTVQGELKPWLVVVQTTLGGGVAGTLIGIANARRDESREVIETQRDRFEALFENLPAETVDVRYEEEKLSVEQSNPGFREVFGIDGTFEGGLFDVVPHDSREREAIVEHVRDGQRYETRVSIELGDEQRAFQLRIAPYGDSGGAYVIYTEVTELVDTQRELEDTVARLERTNERLEDFAYVASHNLQEPLRTVSSFAEILEEDYGDQLGEEGRDHVDTVVTGAHRMESMIDGLLEYSMVTDEEADFETVDAEALCRRELENLESLRKAADGTVTVGSLPSLEADPDQLGQVFHHLLRNALEHSGDDPVSVSIEGEERDHAYHFAVEDDGPGIDPTVRDDVFRMYESGESYERTAKEKGIGLAIVDRIVSRHDGEVWVDSELQQGSTFHFTITKA